MGFHDVMGWELILIGLVGVVAVSHGVAQHHESIDRADVSRVPAGSGSSGARSRRGVGTVDAVLKLPGLRSPLPLRRRRPDDDERHLARYNRLAAALTQIGIAPNFAIC